MTDVQEQITAFWSTVAPGYEAHGGNVAVYGTPEYERWTAAVQRALPDKPSDVLDCGTGTGFLSLIAARLGHRVTGIDLSSEMLELAGATACERGLSADFRKGDATAPAFPAATFDVVMSRHLLWTLREPATAFANWRRLLRPGGRVIAIDGFWFTSAEPAPDLFEQYYNTETRAALPFMPLDDVGPVVAAFEAAGFRHVSATALVDVVEVDDDVDAADRAAVPYLISALG